MPTVEELEAQLAEARAASVQTNIPTTTIPQPVVDPYAPQVWGSNEYDFTCPSGQLCRLQKVDVAKLAESGILDRVTRLPGLAAALVEKSSGLPPAPDAMPDKDTIAAVMEVLLLLLPQVVVKPEIFEIPPDGEERVEGRIYVDSIDTLDQIAIMEKVMAPLAKMDAFRKQS
jgi:hypothetical protein